MYTTACYVVARARGHDFQPGLPAPSADLCGVECVCVGCASAPTACLSSDFLLWYTVRCLPAFLTHTLGTTPAAKAAKVLHGAVCSCGLAYVGPCTCDVLPIMRDCHAHGLLVKKQRMLLQLASASAAQCLPSNLRNYLQTHIARPNEPRLRNCFRIPLVAQRLSYRTGMRS